MPIVQIEHPVPAFAGWKAAFDSDPARREASGVRSYRIYRPIDDPDFVAVDLAFDTREEAVAFAGALERLWQTPEAKRAFGGTPRARVVDVFEERAY